MAEADLPRKRALLGVPMAVTDYGGAIEAIDGLVERRDPGYVCAIAVHALMVSRHDDEMRRALLASTLVVPDGRPLMWALNALGERLEDRVYGPELMRRLCERSPQAGHRIWLYGGETPAVLAQLEEALSDCYPGIVIAGRHAPTRVPLSTEEERETAARIDADHPDLVFVGLGAPRQEKWMASMRPHLEAPVLVGVGAAFDFLAGRKRQAPPWMQERGLEWAFRLRQEPRRLLPRYLRYNPAFVAAFARQYARERRRR